MDANQIAPIIGLSIQLVSTILQSYGIFKNSNVEKYFEQILAEGKDLTIFGEREDLRRYLFKIIDEVSREANIEKIEKWKNVTIHLALDFRDFDYKDNFLRVLSDLTVFDLTVLYKIYSTNFTKEHFESELFVFFESKGVNKEIVFQSLKRLSSHYLISEMTDMTAILAGDDNEPILSETYFVKNQLGEKFLRFISDNFSE